MAIASVGLGRIQRGYERFMQDLFVALRKDSDIVLFKSGGSCQFEERIPAFLTPVTRACRVLPLGLAAGAGKYRSYKHDCLAFGLTLMPHLLRNRFDVVHVVDYPLAIALARLRALFGFRARVIFTDGGLLPPQYYPRVDFVHIPAQAHFLEATGWGIPESRLSMIPAGIHTNRFGVRGDRQQLRKKYGVPDSTFVILSVSALNRGHKRVDHIVEEVSRLEGDVLLWLDGRPEDRTLVDMARQKLGNRSRITHVATAEVPELYHLADLFVHAAVEEGFGLAVTEAAAAGLRVLVHDSAHFLWLIGDRDCLVDMRAPGELFRRLQKLVASAERPRAYDLATRVRAQFDWEIVAPEYQEMYCRVAALQRREAA